MGAPLKKSINTLRLQSVFVKMIESAMLGVTFNLVTRVRPP